METIGKYEVLKPLGRGGMGVVYLARDPVIGREVAVKMIVDQAAMDPTVRRRFLSEAQRAGALNHPNIVTIYDVGEDEGRPFIVMEVLKGSDLRQIMDGMETPPLADRIHVAVQMARGLAAAHQNGILHRDIKPENVIVTDRGVAKVLDFGIARMESEAETVTQAAIGTPRFMSPEQVRGEDIDRRTDIYSFGVVLYELLGGVNPFAGGRVHTVLHKVLNEVPPPVPLPDGAPAALKHIVARCIEKDPEDRYDSFDEVIADLLEADTGPASAPARPMASSRAGANRGKTLALALVGFTLLAAGVGIVLSRTGNDVPATVEELVIEPTEAIAEALPSGDSSSLPPVQVDDGSAPASSSEPIPPASSPAPPPPQVIREPMPASPPVARTNPPPEESAPPPRTADPEPIRATPPPAVEPRRPAAVPPPVDRTAEDRAQATQAINRLGQSLKAAMEAKNTNALAAVHPHYAQMGPLFQIAENVQATVTHSGVTVSGDRATTVTTLAFSYANKTQSNRRESQQVQYTWTLDRSGSSWRLTDVQVR